MSTTINILKPCGLLSLTAETNIAGPDLDLLTDPFAENGALNGILCPVQIGPFPSLLFLVESGSGVDPIGEAEGDYPP